MKTQILISIILPTWKEAQYIKRAIESVLSQSFSNWELIIINDGLYNGIEDSIKEYIRKDKRIILLKNEINLGIQKTLNKGLKRAKGKYIAHIDDDDEWMDKDKLQKQIEFLERNKDYCLIGTGVVVVNEKKEELFRYLNPETDRKIRNKFLKKNCFVHSSILFTKDTALKLGGYIEDEETKYIEDYDFLLRLGLVGKLHNLPIYATLYTSRKNSISSDNKFKQFKKNIALIKKFKGKYPKYFQSVIFSYLRLFFYKIFELIPFLSLKNKIIKLYKEI
jgi:glycosyltransferase involved in cell wall biosynthesis